MSDTYSMTEARANFGTLVRRAAHSRERVAITDHGHIAAILINPQELADLEDSLALAEYQLEKTTGTVTTVSHDHVVREAEGEPRGNAA
ncbi:type II toxin-antitoxin system Phd/YefM family antitoxin [Streptomyces gobiensis]|uniref:type II toxin-antitoxin system Phd/YefM family antitoxin n=1 Tax=Streptomyces gobiensis TaxID=2875706 RepID=UPI001E54CF3B|nr:type II toxin-antitoxin system Phd/YefM family antitoxin [Streptomyces gobiensis]UGY93305.1 type II toxin-antitoxin system Phd/YefM family antitoxin [Streptomyces gobiensis]